MIKRFFYKVISVSLIFICGCATTYKIGEKFNADNVYKITNNETSQKQILQYFGSPWKKGLNNGKDVFIYSYEEIVFHVNDQVEKKGNTLVIEFDEDKIVDNFYFNLPGKEPAIIGLMMHKRKKEKERQIRTNNYVTTVY